jgi:hypothetical protein
MPVRRWAVGVACPHVGVEGRRHNDLFILNPKIAFRRNPRLFGIGEASDSIPVNHPDIERANCKISETVSVSDLSFQARNGITRERAKASH